MRRKRQTILAVQAVVMFVIAAVYFPKAHWVIPASCTFIGVLALAGIAFCKDEEQDAE